VKLSFYSFFAKCKHIISFERLGYITLDYIYREDFHDLQMFTALLFTATGASPAAECMQILPITFGMKGSSYLCSQITGGVENTDPLHVDILASAEEVLIYLLKILSSNI
jgi:hypothetical protein